MCIIWGSLKTGEDCLIKLKAEAMPYGENFTDSSIKLLNAAIHYIDALEAELIATKEAIIF